MAKSILIHGVEYENVPRIDFPLADEEGEASFYETSDATAVAGKIYHGETAYIDGGIVEGTLPDAEHPQPSFSFDDNTGVLTTMHVQEQEGYILPGTTTATLELDIQPGLMYTPGAAAHQIVGAHKYTTGNIVVLGDPNLVPEYIVDGVTIFGVQGTASAGGEAPPGLRVEVVRLI